MALCCGQSSKRRKRPAPRPLPPNPTVRDPIGLLYLGGTYTQVSGGNSGALYHASPHHRDLTVERADVHGILRRRDFILAPGETLRP
jgi:hypothetical protein